MKIKSNKLDYKKIEEAITKKSDGSYHKHVPHKYSTKALSNCVRMSFFDIKLGKVIDDSSYKNFFMGNLLHKTIQDYFLLESRKDFENIEYVENEKEYVYLIPLELVDGRRVIVSGRADTVIHLVGEDYPYVIDFKTTGNVSYNMVSAQDAHVIQTNYYLGCCLGNLGAVVYIDKKDFTIVAHEFSFDNSLFDNGINRVVLLDNCVEKNVVPRKEDSSRNCRYCKRKVLCSKYNEGDVFSE